MYCTTCGKEIPDDSKFCIHCGATVDRTDESIETGSAASQHFPVAQEMSIPRESPIANQDGTKGKLTGMSPAAKAGAAVIAVGLAAGIAFGSYSIYTSFVAPTPQQQSNTAPATSENQSNSNQSANAATQ